MKSKLPSIFFCVDASVEAGGGHISRCLNLAQALKPVCNIAFVRGPDWAPHWIARLRDRGIAVIDAEPKAASVALLDGYRLQQSDVARWKQNASSVVMIEDLGRHFSGVDLYVTPSGPQPQHVDAQILPGPQYALLDVGYAAPVKPAAAVGNILVACGLRDSADLTGLYLDALSGVRGRDIVVAIGAAAPHLDAIKRRTLRSAARLLTDVTDMRSLYDSADIVLGAGGMSLFERMARGRASVTIIAAENQRYAAEMMAKRNGTMLVQLRADAAAQAISTLLGNREARAKIGRAARQIVDGLGVERTAREILALAADSAETASATSD